MKKAILTEIPSHIIAQPAQTGGSKAWVADYNVAAWFRFKEINNESIKLNIIWADEQGIQRVTVDHSSINSAAILMSGVARLKIFGQVKQMSVEVETAHESYAVDELFVQPAHRDPLLQAGNQ